jgi:hypothetical protein
MGLYDKFVGEVGDSIDCSKRELEFKRCYSRDGQYYFPLPLKTRQDVIKLDAELPVIKMVA